MIGQIWYGIKVYEYLQCRINIALPRAITLLLNNPKPFQLYEISSLFVILKRYLICQRQL